jgi:Domain of Unknown Function with PDB structure (DUF3863)
MHRRYLTINMIIRVNQIEVTRDKHIGEDEYDYHNPEDIQKISDIIREGFPDAKLTWAFSWAALFHPSKKYSEIRKLVFNFQSQYGDDITFIPGGFFANRYNSRNQINRDISDAFREIERWTGKCPQTLIAGFLAADNIAYAREHEGVIGVQGNIWSQYSIDNQDGDGSISYPYYPSREHFCKIAQTEEDRIDCVNFDGWTVDFFNGKLNGARGKRNNSRLGVGPIETLKNFGGELGLKEMKATTIAHFETSAPYNPFNWVTVNIEVVLLHQIPAFPLIGEWLKWIKSTWPDVQCPTLHDFCQDFRKEFPDNTQLAYKLVQKGNGIGASKIGETIEWYMNHEFRLGIHIDRRGIQKAFDFTSYKAHYSEPQELGQRNWTLFGEINQKQTRKQDKPIKLKKWSRWPRVKADLSIIYGREKIE